MSLGHAILVTAALALIAGCRDTDESKATARAEEIRTNRDKPMKSELNELELDNQGQIDELLALVSAHEEGVIIYFHIHDKDYRYSDFYAWVRKSDEGYEYNLSGHGSAPTRQIFAKPEDLLARIRSDNSRYSPSDLMHFAAYVDQNAERGADDHLPGRSESATK